MENKENNQIRIENPALRSAMAEMRASETNGIPSKEAQEQFITELLKARLLCPASMEDMQAPLTGTETMKMQGRMKLFVLNTKDGMSFLMAFTDVEELKKWRDQKEEQIVVWGAPQYAEILANPDCPHNGFVINPFGENIMVRKEFVPKLIDRIRKARRPMVLGAEAAKPAELDGNGYPVGLVPALCEYMAGSPDMLSAFLLPDAEETEDYLLIVDTTEDLKYVAPILTSIAEPFLNGKTMKISPFGSNRAQALTAGKTPIYVKKQKEETEE